jgi:hypothetical protein
MHELAMSCDTEVSASNTAVLTCDEVAFLRRMLQLVLTPGEPVMKTTTSQFTPGQTVLRHGYANLEALRFGPVTHL